MVKIPISHSVTQRGRYPWSMKSFYAHLFNWSVAVYYVREFTVPSFDGRVDVVIVVNNGPINLFKFIYKCFFRVSSVGPVFDRFRFSLRYARLDCTVNNKVVTNHGGNNTIINNTVAVVSEYQISGGAGFISNPIWKRNQLLSALGGST